MLSSTLLPFLIGPLALATASPTAILRPEADQDAEEAIALVRAGEYEKARELLGRILVRRELEQAQARMQSGDPRDALLCYDRVLELEPKNAEALFLRGRASFEAGNLYPSNAQGFYEEALASYEHAWQRGFGLDALLEASRAARMANRSERALDLALQAARELERHPDVVAALSQPPERTLAEASFGRYVEKVQSGDSADELFLMSEDCLTKLLGRTPTDAWAWLQLANLYQWHGEPKRALEEVQRGLEGLPASAELHARLVDLRRAEEGREGVIAYYADFVKRYPTVALGWWYGGVEQVLRGCDRVGAGEDARTDFESAERHFQSCREREPQYEQDCRGYEAICRAGCGWSAIKAKDLAAAEKSFLAMEDVIERGLSWAYAPYLGSGVQGLQMVADEYYVGHEEEAAAVANAVAIYDFLQKYLPDDGTIANNAGFFNRDLAVLLDQQAELALARARGQADPNTRDKAESEARELRVRATERMQRSYEAYVRAAELAPNDARIQNDTGLIMVYYLRTDARVAEDYFQRAVKLATAQLPDEAYLASLPDSVREDLPVALGDAYQNLGVLYLTMLRSPERAMEAFNKSIEIGPADRVNVRDQWLPACERMKAGDPDALKPLRREIWLHEGR